MIDQDNKTLPIVFYPDPILFETCRPVEKFDDDLQQFVDGMYVTVKEYEGIGLAAPQVGLNERLFVLFFLAGDSLIDDTPLKALATTTKDGDLAVPFINPEIVSVSDETETERERCLSIPRVTGHVTRPFRIVIKAYNLKGEAFEVELDGLPAKAAQHEMDHLCGKLFTDYLTGIEKDIAESKLRVLRRDFDRHVKKANNKAERSKKKKPKRH